MKLNGKQEGHLALAKLKSIPYYFYEALHYNIISIVIYIFIFTF